MSRRRPTKTVISLFTGAGGLDVGLETAGFEHLLCVENDADALATLKHNRPHWRLAEPGDIHRIAPQELLRQAGLRRRQLTLLAGGPPCQPFSKSAYWANGNGTRLRDPRARTLQAFMRVVDAALPRVVLLENVGGLVFAGKDEGFRSVKRAFGRINKRHGTKYKAQVHHLNAADYGVPQFRRRVFIVAAIDGSGLTIPKPTHGDGPGLKPYNTTWDAIGDLDRKSWPPALKVGGRWADLLPSIPEGHNYLWHTPRNAAKGAQPLFGWRTKFWSFLLKLAKDRPSWTIQAQPGPATGPFHWRNRLLTVTELCRLQTFPRGYRIKGGRTEAQRQVGNAVPSAIGEFLGLEIRRQFLGEKVRRDLRLTPRKRRACPAKHRVSRVPTQYLDLRAKHLDHPGAGCGPGAIHRKGSHEPT